MGKDDNTFAPGDVVSGLESSELVEIQRVAPFGGKTLVEGVGLQSRRMVKRPLAAEELAALLKVRGQQHTFNGDARLFLLGAEAERIRIAHQFDPLFAVNSSIVDPLSLCANMTETSFPCKLMSSGAAWWSINLWL